MEASRNGRVVLYERPSHRVPGKLFVDKCIVAQQSSMCSKRNTANVTSGRRKGKDIGSSQVRLSACPVAHMFLLLQFIEIKMIGHQEATMFMVSTKKTLPLQKMTFYQLPGILIFADRTGVSNKLAGNPKPQLQAYFVPE